MEIQAFVGSFLNGTTTIDYGQLFESKHLPMPMVPVQHTAHTPVAAEHICGHMLTIFASVKAGIRSSNLLLD